MKKRPKIIAVDFDGCIVKNKFPEIGEINQELVQKMRREKDNGTVIIIWTCRNENYTPQMINFLKDNNIPFDYINENVPWLPFETSRKIYADSYWDDRAVCMTASDDNPEQVEMKPDKFAKRGDKYGKD